MPQPHRESTLSADSTLSLRLQAGFPELVLGVPRLPPFLGRRWRLSRAEASLPPSVCRGGAGHVPRGTFIENTHLHVHPAFLGRRVVSAPAEALAEARAPGSRVLAGAEASVSCSQGTCRHVLPRSCLLSTCELLPGPRCSTCAHGMGGSSRAGRTRRKLTL